MLPRDPDERMLDAARSAAPEDEGLDRDPDEFEPTRRLGAVARSLADDDMAFDEPPPRVWASITEVVEVESGTGGSGRAWWVLRRPLAAAAAVVLLVVVATGTLVVWPDRDDGAVTVASVQLEPLVDVDPADSDRTTVEVIERDGRFGLNLLLAEEDLPTFPGYYEVWLLDPAAEGMVSLGPLREDGAYEIPPGVDHTDYPIVDISREPHDGDPTHSGDSILRGEAS